MAHMIDTTKGAAIAYVGATPWHGLGQQLSADADIETWQREARLNYNVERSPVQYQNGELRTFADREVLYRSDTGGALSVVSKYYQVVQPSQVLAFFSELAKLGGFQLETAGALSGGKRVWALARIGEGANIVKGDKVDPYVLLATSYDGTMATTARFTAIRVVCHNTLSAAYGRSGDFVHVYHSTKFDAEAVRKQLGIFSSDWEKFLHQAKDLAHKKLNESQADEFLIELIAPAIAPSVSGPAEVEQARETARKSRGYKSVMELFKGKAIGSEIRNLADTRWQMLNSVTQYVDHERGNTPNTRLESAWFGEGSKLKSRALELLSV